MKTVKRVPSIWRISASRHLATGSLIVMIAATAACGGSANDSGARSNVLIERWSASVGDPVALDPAHALYTLPQASIPYALFDQLTSYDVASGKIVPMLAEQFSSNETATVWTLVLRANATWHDGQPVLPSDVKFAWERVVDPKTASRWAALFSSIKGYEACRSGAVRELAGLHADDASRTLTIELGTPFSEFPGWITQLPFSPVPARVVSRLPAGARWDDQLLIGSGAFRMVEPWKHGRYIELARFDRYYGGKAGHPALLDGIEFRVGKDVDASFTELEAGIAHIAFTPPSRYVELKSRADLDVIDDPMSATWYLGFNMQDPTVGGSANVLLREAISLALDRPAIVAAVYQGGRRVGFTLTPPEVPGYHADVAAVRARDVAAARAKLVSWGGPSKLTRPIRFIYNTGSGQENVAALIQANLAAVGILMEVKSLDAAQFAGEILKPGTMMFRQLITYTYPSPGAGLYPLLHSAAAGTNLSRYSNPRVDATLDEARGTLDENERNALYARAEATALADFAVIPVFHYKAAAVLAKTLRNARFVPSGYMTYGEARLE